MKLKKTKKNYCAYVQEQKVASMSSLESVTYYDCFRIQYKENAC